jgi:hypothetical protein
MICRGKEQYKLLPRCIAQHIVGRIDETHELLAQVDAYSAMPDGPAQERACAELSPKIRDYNRVQLSMVRSQQRPIDVGFTRQQWFDTDEAFAKVMAMQPV